MIEPISHFSIIGSIERSFLLDLIKQHLFQDAARCEPIFSCLYDSCIAAFLFKLMCISASLMSVSWWVATTTVIFF